MWGLFFCSFKCCKRPYRIRSFAFCTHLFFFLVVLVVTEQPLSLSPCSGNALVHLLWPSIYYTRHTGPPQRRPVKLTYFPLSLKSVASLTCSRLAEPLLSLGNGDSSMVRAPDSWSKGCGFESLQELRENFLLQGQLSVLTLISVSVPPRVTQ